ncbi:MAG: hypothetical protein BVN29_10915 [Nitrospira sp. ST-bin5]|nr:MAG: hypothetical protein BVN29_10915 [Nitrospira sp. ST-bin5]
MQEKAGATVTANLLTGLGIDEFLTRTDGAGTRGLLTDALGSTVALGDGTGTIQTQYTYEPFGYASQTGAANTNSYKYTGREDDGSGLYYYRARYYHPRLQRFVAEDPIEFRGGSANFYVYVGNGPLTYIDPTGLVSADIGVSGTFGVNGFQCTLRGCRTTITVPPEIKVPLQCSVDEPPSNLDPVNINVTAYQHHVGDVGFGFEGSIGTYIYNDPSSGPGSQTTLQGGMSMGFGFGMGLPFSISK